MAAINLFRSPAVALLVLSSISVISHTNGRLLPPMGHLHVNLTRSSLHRKIVQTASVAPLKSSRQLPFPHTPIAASDAELQGGDFRPTTPGHSPGAGHSLAPASYVDPKIH